jgi:hypothetical protein
VDIGRGSIGRGGGAGAWERTYGWNRPARSSAQ